MPSARKVATSRRRSTPLIDTVAAMAAPITANAMPTRLANIRSAAPHAWRSLADNAGAALTSAARPAARNAAAAAPLSRCGSDRNSASRSVRPVPSSVCAILNGISKLRACALKSRVGKILTTFASNRAAGACSPTPSTVKVAYPALRRR